MTIEQKTATPDDLLRALKWRYAVQKFDANRKIPTEIWNALEESLVLTPSSFGLQPWKFFIVTRQELKDRLAEACWNQRQVAEASHVVVLAARRGINVEDVDRHLQRVVEVRGVPMESLARFRKAMIGFTENPPTHIDLDEWAAKQVYIALGQFMAAAAVLGVDTCPMEGFDVAKIDGILNLSARGYTVAALAPAGYRSPDDKKAAIPKVRFKTDDVVERLD